jgi:peptide/nickel transport system ATP-binding protein
MIDRILVQNLKVCDSETGKQILTIDKLEINTKILTGIYGESGGGKSTLVNTINGLNAGDRNLSIEGSIGYYLPNFKSTFNFQQLPHDYLTNFRGKHVFTINQYLNSGFSPVHRVGIQLSDMYTAVRKADKETIQDEFLFWSKKFGIDHALLNRFPSQLSGGEIQRLHLVLGFALKMDFLLCDEMSSALDDHNTMEIFTLIKDISTFQRIGAILVSHEEQYLREYCDTLIYISDGKIFEMDSPSTHIQNKVNRNNDQLSDIQPLLECRDLKMSFLDQLDQRNSLIENLNLSLFPGTITSISGTSGIGKSTLGKILAGLIAPDSGKVLFQNRDLAELNSNELKLFNIKVQYIYQDAFMSLNPAKKLKDIMRINIEEALKQGINTTRDAKDDLLRLFEFDTVDLNCFPHQLSGGQVQRFQLINALLFQPQVLILDEPFSALDMSMRKKIMNVLVEIKNIRQLCCLIITHQMDIIHDNVNFSWKMKNGKLVDLD